MKTARFKKIVTACGRPRIHLTWVKPEKDRELMKLLKAGRVMTVHQAARGSGKDFGTVGLFKEGRNTQLLVFPRSLRRFAESRVVGIDYTLLEVERPAAVAEPARKPPAPKAPAKLSGERLDFPSPKTPPAPPVATKPIAPGISASVPPSISREIKRALRDLQAGRTTAAQARLEKLLGAH